MKTVLLFTVWVSLLLIGGPRLLESQWECALVMFAALTLVPKGLLLMDREVGSWYWLVVAGLCSAYLLNTPGMGPTDVLAFPYLLVAAWYAVNEAVVLFFEKKGNLLDWVRLFALGYWATGAFWALCFLLDVHPIGFDPVMVSLTAAHFHVAGFVLTVVVWRLYSHERRKTNRLLALGVLAGMPLVALGITLSKLGYPPFMETLSASCFAGLAGITVGQHIRLFLYGNQPLIVRLYWLAGAVCLLVGAILAATYGLRIQFPIEWINIPNMKIWHGTLNTLGFGWLTLQGWERWQPRQQA